MHYIKIKPLKIQEESQWLEDRNSHLENIRAIHRSNQLSLFLGAGISQSAGLPSWSALLQKLDSLVVNNICTGKEYNLHTHIIERVIKIIF